MVLRFSVNLCFVDEVVRKNVAITMESIHRESPILNEMLNEKDIKMFGGMYDNKSGKVEFDL